MEMTAECGASEELREIIWDAIQSTRSKLDEETAHGTFRQHMSKVLTEVPTLAEFSSVIKKGWAAELRG